MKKIGELLIEHNLLSRKDLEKALAIQRNQPAKEPIGEILISMGAITIPVLTEYLSLQMKRFGK